MVEEGQTGNEQVLHGLRQLARYGAVGFLNTAIDFALTNALAIFTGASGPAALFIISLTATLIATLTSYRLNRSWTFGLSDKQLPRSTLAKYFSVAFLAMMVNTSVFLFVYQFLTDQMLFDRLLAINLAKITGVATASIVAFLGYRIIVFRPTAVELFRGSYRFQEASEGIRLSIQILVLTASSLLVRLLFLTLTTAVYGEATSYGWVADAIARGDWTQAESGWLNLYCYWEALFYLFHLTPIQSAIGASLVPGVLLVIPVAWTARCLYGERVAWLAGLLMVVHPRLISYSCNGFPESFYLFALALGMAILTVSNVQKLSSSWMVAAGMCFGALFAVYNEGIILVVAAMIGLLLLGRRAIRGGIPTISSWALIPSRTLAQVTVGFMIVTAAYVGFTELKIGRSGLFTKVSAFEKKYAVQIDPQSAAREVYGLEGQGGTGEWRHFSVGEHAWFLLARFPSNLLQTLKTTPGVLLTPMWFFALMLPLFSKSRDRTMMPEWPWLAILFFPFIIYPLVYVDAKFLFPVILPTNLFGAAGLVALAVFIGNRGFFSYFYPFTVATVLAVCLLVAAWRGTDIENGYKYNRVLASWVQKNVPPGETIVGCGYGFVSTTGFLAHYPTINRLLHYDPKKIVQFVREKHAQWLILYEPFVLRVNPELESVFSRGMPGMTMVFQTTDNLQRRIQVYHLDPEGQPSFFKIGEGM